MHVILRDGTKAPIRYDKITDRNKELATDLNVDVAKLSKNVIASLKDGMKTSEIDNLCSETAFYMSTYEPEFDKLAVRIAASNLQKSTTSKFSEMVYRCYHSVDEKSKKSLNILSESFYNFVQRNKDSLDNAIVHERDFLFSYFGFKTLTKAYLLKIGNEIVERPQYMWMRVACAIHMTNFETDDETSVQKAIQTYNMMSTLHFTHASPTLFNSGSNLQQLSSCFLLTSDDDLNHIYTTLLRTALISKHAGGIGIDISRIRAKGSTIHSTNGRSDGIVPMIKVFNASGIYCNQCFTPETLIVTMRGKVEIQYVQIGDFVLTRDGTYKPVVDIHKRDIIMSDKVLQIKTEVHSKTVNITGQHQVYVYDSKSNDLILKDAIDLKKGDMLYRPYQTSQPSNSINHSTYAIEFIKEINYSGLVYDLSVLNNNNYVVEGLGLVSNSGRRKGSIAMYLEPWHADVLDFLQLRYNAPPDEIRARDIFLGMWINDLFMKRVEKNEMWSLFCPSVVPQLTETYGEEFETIYLQAEKDKKYVKQLPAQEVWKAILNSQIETGLPYICYKDAANEKSNQKNLGIVRSSNLCTEVLEVTDNQSVSVCNLASISLPAFVDIINHKFNYEKLGEVVEIITENLNKVIDINFYPINEAKTNNLNYRPIGIGIQGLADVFALLDYCWGDEGSKKTNKLIAETIYYYSLKKSCELSKLYGSYNGFQGSPASEGILQYHMWGVTPLTSQPDCEIYLDWETLISNIKQYGLRNSLLVAPMPTASTSQILNNNESFESFTSNIFSRSTLAGDFTIVNKHLYRDLTSQNLWSSELVNKILSNDGSIQSIEEIPQSIKNKYKTVWELSQRISIDYAADRGAFVDQSQSLNLYLDYPTHSKLTSMHFYGWRKGLKTNNYYIHSKPSRGAVKFTVSSSNTNSQQSVTESQKPKFKCVGDDGTCVSCSS
jgi:ribonucleoside-diphosphate reductase alpha subunit